MSSVQLCLAAHCLSFVEQLCYSYEQGVMASIIATVALGPHMYCTIVRKATRNFEHGHVFYYI